MHETVLVHADVDEGPEVGYVGHYARQPHAGLDIVDLLNTLGELHRLELLTGRGGFASSSGMSFSVGRPTCP